MRTAGPTVVVVALTLSAATCRSAASTEAAPTVPGAPTAPVATSGNLSASIAFQPPASNGGSAIVGYSATCTAASESKTGSSPASPLLVVALTNGTLYSCSVRASNALGIGGPSPSVTVTPAPRSVPN